MLVSITFSFAIAALLEGKVDRAWPAGCGHGRVGMGVFDPWYRAWPYWAYYELGWGGFWFWDPVENASLMPWLAGTALLHSALSLSDAAH